MGVLRLDLEESTARLSIYLDPQLTGQGIGTGLLRAIVAWAYKNLVHTRRIEALIKTENIASRRAFEAAGFRDESSCFVHYREEPRSCEERIEAPQGASSRRRGTL